ncbi:hypothetical protein DV515_00004448 [Chloebia gouldiae]|uniref:Uncharacterized protein n=1 Tax=Chloebia gouldiae TaxID=44316 RepID=A0A3L8SQY9_CHLGU|nr:hypothetical protein DV515_00004448 [Chloebia gouldiae]
MRPSIEGLATGPPQNVVLAADTPLQPKMALCIVFHMILNYAESKLYYCCGPFKINLNPGVAQRYSVDLPRCCLYTHSGDLQKSWALFPEAGEEPGAVRQPPGGSTFPRTGRAHPALPPARKGKRPHKCKPFSLGSNLLDYYELSSNHCCKTKGQTTGVFGMKQPYQLLGSHSPYLSTNGVKCQNSSRANLPKDVKERFGHVDMISPRPVPEPLPRQDGGQRPFPCPAVPSHRCTPRREPRPAATAGQPPRLAALPRPGGLLGKAALLAASITPRPRLT